jgi:flavorubredoxin
MGRITESIRYIGVNDCEKTLFEGIWPLPFGVSYNSYLVVDEKIALIDTVEEGFEEEYIGNIKEEIGDRAIEYLIVNHCEPDHSSLLSLILGIYPEILVVTNAKAAAMLKGYYGLRDEKLLIVRDGDKLDLGTKSLTFYMTPMLHWPETMMTWDSSEKTLFSGDAFGSFRALGQEIRDGFETYKDEMIRYYSNIVGKYGAAVQTALKRLGGLEIGRICSTHGPVWEKEADKVVGLYDRMSRYEAEPGVCIAYGSMYGNTAKAAHALAGELSALGIPYVLHDLNTENVSAAIRDVFRYDTLAVGSPTYNGGIYPPVEAFIRAVASRMVRNRSFVAFGSFTWAGASVRQLNEYAAGQGFDLINEGMYFAQAYSPEKCDMTALAKTIKTRLK